MATAKTECLPLLTTHIQSDVHRLDVSAARFR